MKYLFLTVIVLYRKLLSPILVHLLGHSCRFLPTCSEYSYEAISMHGVLKGIPMSARRISKCHPGTPFSYDPVK